MIDIDGDLYKVQKFARFFRNANSPCPLVSPYPRPLNPFVYKGYRHLCDFVARLRMCVESGNIVCYNRAPTKQKGARLNSGHATVSRDRVAGYVE